MYHTVLISGWTKSMGLDAGRQGVYYTSRYINLEAAIDTPTGRRKFDAAGKTTNF
jgi:hypothetical protein